MRPLTVDEARAIAARLAERRARFGATEDETSSFLVVLLNAGWERDAVHCLGGEWAGTKGDICTAGQIPHCPNGHVLMESILRVRLGFVEVAA